MFFRLFFSGVAEQKERIQEVKEEEPELRRKQRGDGTDMKMCGQFQMYQKRLKLLKKVQTVSITQGIAFHDSTYLSFK